MQLAVYLSFMLGCLGLFADAQQREQRDGMVAMVNGQAFHSCSASFNTKPI